MEQKTKHGGKRAGAGRKPVEDKKVRIQVYVKQSIIKKLGGYTKTRKIALAAILTTAK